MKTKLEISNIFKFQLSTVLIVSFIIRNQICGTPLGVKMTGSRYSAVQQYRQ